MKKMKFTLKFLVSVVLGCFVIMSCSQDSIFYDLSIEPEPVEPLIAGSPTNMAVVGNKLYVGTRMGRTIYFYTSAGWSSMGSPNGSLGELASDGTNLYALVFPGGDPLKNSVIYRYDETADPAWTALERDTTAEGYSLQTLYAVDGDVFAGGQIRGSGAAYYAILHYDPASAGGKLTKIREHESDSLLRGAAKSGTNTYLATAGNGIFEFPGGAAAVNETPVTGTEGKVINGILNVNGIVTAVSNDGGGYGSVFIADGAPNAPVTSFNVQQMGYIFTGGMGVWKKYIPPEVPEEPGAPPAGVWKDTLLLLGIRDTGSSLTHGYRELILDTASSRPISSIQHPGDSYGLPTSVSSESKYNASIGIHPVQSIMQVPDGILDYTASIAAHGESWQPLIFAGTSRDGLWSYKGDQWNAED